MRPGVLSALLLGGLELPELVKGSASSPVDVKTSLIDGKVRHTAVVDGGHSSMRDTRVAIERAAYELRSLPEQVRHVEVKVDRHAQAAIEAAAAKRARRARRGAR